MSKLLKKIKNLAVGMGKTRQEVEGFGLVQY